MASLIVVTSPALAAGFRLAGARTVSVRDAGEAARVIAALDAEDAGVLAIHAPYLDALPSALRRRLLAQPRPVVVAIPDGLTAEDPGQRRRRLSELLERAVGFRLRLPGEEEA